MTVGFKGTDANLKCRDTQFEIGKTYIIDGEKKCRELKEGEVFISSDTVKTCTDSGIHYCKELKNCFSHYANNGSNRFFEVEILGKETFDAFDGKAATNCIKFLREISKEELEAIKLEGKLKLEEVRKLQTQFPNLILSGSPALYLQGFKLKRVENNGIGDLDFVHPWYINLEEDVEGFDTSEELPSGCDFGSQFFSDKGTKIDIRVDNNRRYTIVELNGFKYKVADFRDVLEAKIKYSRKRGGNKHMEDLINLLKSN